MEKTIEDIKREIRGLLSEGGDNNVNSVENISLENTLAYTLEQYAEISLGLKQINNHNVFSAKEVIDAL